MKASVRLHREDGEPLVVRIALPDFIAWEKHSKRKTSDLAAGWALEDWSWLAWKAETRTGRTSARFDEWVADFVELEPIADDAHPTRGGA